MTRRSPSLLAVAAGIGLAAACERPGPPAPMAPVTRVETVVDTIHGEAFPDPYRWLEDQRAPETRAWLAAQEAYTNAVFPRDGARRALEARLTVLMNRAEIGAPRRGGAFEYFTLRRTGDPLAAIYRRPVPPDAAAPPAGTPADRAPIDPAATYEVVVDPRPLSADQTTRVELVSVDRQGRYLVYAVRDGGQDEHALRIRDLATGRDLDDAFPPALYSSIVPTAAGDGFYYSLRSRQTGARIRKHLWATDTAPDTLVFGEGYGPTAFVSVLQSDDGRWLVFTAQHGWASTDVFALDTRAPRATPIEIARGLDARFYPRFVNGELWMRTDLGAPRNRVVAVSLARPAQSAWRTVVAEQPEVLEDVTVIDGAIYAQLLHEAANRIVRFDMDGTRRDELPVPPMHSASIRGNGPGHAVLTLESFAAPEASWRVDLATGARAVDRAAEIPYDGRDVEVRYESATSKDGTRVPVWVVHKKGLARTGATPTLLFGYGGFYTAQKPSFSPLAAAWVDAGGVYAMAILRGGSEFGETWHRAGMLTNKLRVFEDFIAAGEWLVRERYASPQTLGIMGTSNGGLLVGAALTMRPDLFRAVLCGFPDVDILRFNQYTTNNNMPALLEYGDAAVKAQFDVIRTYSPYQAVRAGTPYPAVLVATGDLDTRVPPLAGRKFTARLQAATTSGHPVLLRYHVKSGHAANYGMPFGLRVQQAAMDLHFMMRELRLPLPPAPAEPPR
ncbi:MAG: S9 family peptidase [Acidobacteria bacterium]|nr:S9 family peptidase [Acidobacteriota bacterium]